MNKKVILILLIIIISAVFVVVFMDIENIRTQSDQVTKHEGIGNVIWVKADDMQNVNFNLLKKSHIDTIFLNYGAIDTYGEDTVAQWVSTAKSNGINVHIWMQVLYNDGFVNPLKNGELNNELLQKDINDSITYASIPGIQGVVLDYIRYPGNASDNPNGDKAIDSFVGNLSTSIKSVNSNLLVSGTFMPESSGMLSAYGQDLNVLKDSLDYVIPMMYKGNYNQSSYWIESTTHYFKDNSGDAKVLISLQTYGSDDDINSINSTELEDDIVEAFIGGADGVALFRYGLLDFNNFDTNVKFNIFDIFNIRFNSFF